MWNNSMKADNPSRPHFYKVVKMKGDEIFVLTTENKCIRNLLNDK